MLVLLTFLSWCWWKLCRMASMLKVTSVDAARLAPGVAPLSHGIVGRMRYNMRCKRVKTLQSVQTVQLKPIREKCENNWVALNKCNVESKLGIFKSLELYDAGHATVGHSWILQRYMCITLKLVAWSNKTKRRSWGSSEFGITSRCLDKSISSCSPL